MKLQIEKSLIPLAVTLAVIFLTISCSDKQEENSRQSVEDFRFRMIRKYIGDSSQYFRAIDSIYADFPQAESLLYKYDTRRGYYYTEKRSYEMSLNYADSMLQVVKQLKNKRAYMQWYGIALSYKAQDLHALQRYDESFYFYFLAREAILKTGDICQLTNSTAMLGNIAYKRKNYEEAVGFYKEAFRKRLDCDRNNDPNKEHTLFAAQQAELDNIGLCYSRMNMQDSAVYYFDSALSYIRSNAHKAFRYDNKNNKVFDTAFVEAATAVVYGNLGKELMLMKNDSAAERLLRESIRINSKPGRAVEDVPWSVAKLAELYIDQNRFTEAVSLLLVLQQSLDTFSYPELNAKWNLLQFKVAEANKDFITANRYLSRYVNIKDSLNGAEITMTSPNLRKQLNYLRNEYELDLLQKDNKLKTIYLVVFAIGAGLSVVVILLIWWNNRLSKKHIAALAQLNEKISANNSHLEKAFSALENSHAENTRLMKMVAHDLRNPVGSIAGMSDFLMKGDHYNPTEWKMLEMIRSASRDAVHLIEDILQGKMSDAYIKKNTTDLSILVSYCVDMFLVKAREKGQLIRLQIYPCIVIGDREKLWRVFSNLIGNAIKFSPRNTEIEIEFITDGQTVTISVKDRGIGIPEYLQEKVFRIPEDAQREGTSGESSYGMGLAICKQIIDAHNGKLWFEDRVGGGAVFNVSLTRMPSLR